MRPLSCLEGTWTLKARLCFSSAGSPPLTVAQRCIQLASFEIQMQAGTYRPKLAYICYVVTCVLYVALIGVVVP